jgi:hypothetical protein
VKDRVSSLLLAIAAAIVLWYVLSRLRIVVFVNLPWWVLALVILGAILVLYLALDHLFNRSR